MWGARCMNFVSDRFIHFLDVLSCVCLQNAHLMVWCVLRSIHISNVTNGWYMFCARLSRGFCWARFSVCILRFSLVWAGSFVEPVFESVIVHFSLFWAGGFVEPSFQCAFCAFHARFSRGFVQPIFQFAFVHISLVWAWVFFYPVF